MIFTSIYNKYKTKLIAQFNPPEKHLVLPSPTKHKFDKKYKTIVRVKSSPAYMEMVEWLNKNSIGSIDMYFNDTPDGILIDVAFENPDDALFFKIKYQTCQ